MLAGPPSGFLECASRFRPYQPVFPALPHVDGENVVFSGSGRNLAGPSEPTRMNKDLKMGFSVGKAKKILE